MAFRDMSPETMVTISDRWRDAMRDRPVIASLPLAAPLLPLIDAAHAELIARQGLSAAILDKIRIIQDQQEIVDARHDRKKRGAHMLLTGYAELADDPAKAAAFLALRDRLMPGGRLEIQRSYLDEIGDAKRLSARLGIEDHALLASVRTPGGTLAQEVSAWLQAADELEKLHEQRMAFEQSIGQSQTRPADARDAKYNWIRVARLLEANVQADPAATDEIKERILGPLYRVATQAGRRRATTIVPADDEASGDTEPGAPDVSAP